MTSSGYPIAVREESPEKRFTLDMAVISGKDKCGLTSLPHRRDRKSLPLFFLFRHSKAEDPEAAQNQVCRVTKSRTVVDQMDYFDHTATGVRVRSDN
ncbi:MAG: hypothetical protein IH917_03800 [Acidobacteria bacterium]|nr:hypothetical protein [Acidobacteriota bacterium]